MPRFTDLQALEAPAVRIFLPVKSPIPGDFPCGQGVDAYLRNLAAGAPNAGHALVLVDARSGVLPQTRRESHLLALLGIRHIVLAVNNMDLVGYSGEAFDGIAAQYRVFAARIGLRDVTCIPVSTAEGDNVAAASRNMPWHGGPTLFSHLESLSIDAAPGSRPGGPAAETADQFEATLVWLGDAPMLPGRTYPIRIGAVTAKATVAPLKYRIGPDTLEHVAATKLEARDVGVCQLELDRPVAFAPYDANPALGGFVLMDPNTGETVGAGMIAFALRRSRNVAWQPLDVDRAARAALKGQRPCVVWFTGLSGAGKSTIANLLDRNLHAMGRHSYVLDGDNLRHGLNKDLGFTEAARVENIRRVAEVARLMADAGLIVIAAFISPFRNERRMARSLLPPGEFLEVFVDTPLAVAEARDPKGLYRKARRGELANFTGIDSPYEAPENPDVRVDGAEVSAEAAAEAIMLEMRRRGLL